MTTDRVMLLIDADNVSVDVIDQTVRLLMKQHGALHVRRAYCTAEGALKHQAVFKRLGIKPMVNLAAGKNSTDIALAVDAIDLVLAERPDVVAIASSDSDFAPLVQRLREKGCVVRGFGQQGKTGDETQDVYDDFTVLEHRKPAAAAGEAQPARKTAARKSAARKAAGSKLDKEVVKEVARETAKEPAKAPAKKAARKTASRRAAASEKAAAMADAVLEVVAAREPAPTPAPAPAAVAAPAPQHETARKILECMPELGHGERLELRVASQRLREAGLLSRSGSSTKLLGQFPELFELLPPGQPNHLRLRR